MCSTTQRAQLEFSQCPMFRNFMYIHVLCFQDVAGSIKIDPHTCSKNNIQLNIVAYLYMPKHVPALYIYSSYSSLRGYLWWRKTYIIYFLFTMKTLIMKPTNLHTHTCRHHVYTCTVCIHTCTNLCMHFEIETQNTHSSPFLPKQPFKASTISYCWWAKKWAYIRQDSGPLSTCTYTRLHGAKSYVYA